MIALNMHSWELFNLLGKGGGGVYEEFSRAGIILGLRIGTGI